MDISLGLPFNALQIHPLRWHILSTLVKMPTITCIPPSEYRASVEISHFFKVLKYSYNAVLLLNIKIGYIKNLKIGIYFFLPTLD